MNGAWTLDVISEDGERPFEGVPATVPGSVYHDLLTADKIPDPFWRDNEEAALALMENDFCYTRAFEAPEALISSDAVLLRCEGLDTLAEIRLNGAPVGTADNMHRTWEFDVRGQLKPGANEISVLLRSPTRFIRQANEACPLDGSGDAMRGFSHLRKAHCMFGWDWGPRLPDAGIWRDIEIIGVQRARIGDVLIRQRHEPGRVTCAVSTRVEALGDAPWEVEAVITAPDGRAFSAKGESCAVEIDHPMLWWPRGYGDQPLYGVCVRLLSGDMELDRWEGRIGLRTLTVRRERDAWGESFCHRVNGVDIFAMGADYIPEDNLLPRVTPGRTRALLEDAALANMNTVRVWGGGYYPDDGFYDTCDELGLLVWQDFMFACAEYRLTDALEASLRAEFTDNIRRLRHHASLALWCGNNEIESFTGDGKWFSSKRFQADYIKIFEYILPQVVKREDPDAFYWPSSPSSGGSFDNPQNPDVGDVHYWDVWHGMKPFTDYRNHLFRYVSEFGFQSFPCMDTIARFTLPEDRNVYAYVMEKHQRNASANGKIAEYLSQTYRYPASLDGFVYASQLLQAQAIQYGVEHWRRNRGRCMGALVWQLNDCWPVVSWASIDYYGCWKALHYYEKRFFAPVLISCREEGTLSQRASVNDEPAPLKMTARLNVCNETRSAFSGVARWSLRRADASVIREGSFEVQVPPLSAVWLDEQDFSGEDARGCYYAYELYDARGEYAGGGTALFCAPKHFRFLDPQLKAWQEGDEIVVAAAAYARSVEIQCGSGVVLSDNFFDMNAGERRMKVLRGTPSRVKAWSVYDIG
ncbi:MAG: glycoside hydrolase family 2 protein [Clostridia bacterium]|nr:glycoside hydrolase family 2 protein [Clostridia bacterium]